VSLHHLQSARPDPQIAPDATREKRIGFLVAGNCCYGHRPRGFHWREFFEQQEFCGAETGIG
jgi:hypothetical protein